MLHVTSGQLWIRVASDEEHAHQQYKNGMAAWVFEICRVAQTMHVWPLAAALCLAPACLPAPHLQGFH